MKTLFENKIVQGVLTAVITAISLTILWLMVDVRDFIKFRQPQRDEQQDIRIKELNNYFNQRCQMMDSLNSNKFQNVNKRIDNYFDYIHRIEEKIDKLLTNKYTVEK